jgi:hypothetical protein
MKTNIVDIVTDDFCESFTKESDYQGFTARLIADEILPEGVCPRDGRVQEIIRKCRRAAGERISEIR